MSVTNDGLTKKILDLELPLVKIETVNEEEPTCDYVSPPANGDGRGITNATKVPGKLMIIKGSDVLFNSGEYVKSKSGMTISVRGNTSAYGNKKPYKIKLQNKADLLFRDNEDIYKDKNWLLLKDEDLRTMIGLKVNELLGLQWTPSFTYTNVIINGEYRGVYMLIESVKRNNKCRLNVDDDGFIFENDAYWWNEKVKVMTDLGSYTFKYPDPDAITDSDLEAFKAMIFDFEKSFDDDTYPQYIDVRSFATWLLAQEILGNKDPGGSNIFLTKKNRDKTSKIMMGNMWDFDNILRTRDWYCRQIEIGIYCFGKLWKKPHFREKYIEKWYEIEPLFFNEVQTFLIYFSKSKEAKAIDSSLVLDGIRWGIDRESVSSRIDFMKEWFFTRRKWVQKEIDDMIN